MIEDSRRTEGARPSSSVSDGQRKICHGPACRGEVRAAADFYRNKVRRDGLSSQCKHCQSEYTSRPHVRVRANESKSAWQRCNPDKCNARAKRWRDANPDRARAVAKAYRDSHPLEERLRSGRLRAQHAGLAADDITAAALLADWERRGIDPTRCVYTGEPLQDGWHLDHAYPLSLPGSPGHVVANLVPANRGVNASKRNRHWVHYLADRAEVASAGAAVSSENQ